MSVPKKRQLNITPSKVGQSRIDELLTDTDKKTSYFPPGISIKDLETGMMDFIRELNFTIGGEKVPVVFLPGERWSEFSRNWQYLDQDKNVVMPVIIIRRSAPPSHGTSVITKYNIPGRKTFTYMRIPTLDGGGYRGVDIYKIPQPTSVDCRFELRLFSHYIQDMNKFGELLLIDFSSRQSYQKIKGFYMPIIIDGNPSDESTIENFDGDRFYSQVYSLILMGYIQDEQEFEISKGVKKVIFFTEVDNDFITISGSTVSGGT